MPKALIHDGAVVQIADAEFDVHPSMTWVDCSSDVQVGWFYDGSSFSAQVETLNDEQKLAELRIERNFLLASTDWWALSDHTMTQAQIDYRQALRDITETYSSLDDVVWPDAPQG